ncbi:MAG: hypothetical protein Q9181_003439 [Wetmoreana brouardii]
MPIGSSTAPCVLSSAIYHLLQIPSCITKAQGEIDSAIGNNEFTHAYPVQLSYCTGIVRESLRLSAAAPGFNIEPLPDTQPSSRIRKPFKPERIVGETYENLPARAKKWFGNGKRVCYGKSYAFVWSVIVLVMLLKEADFGLADSSYKFKQNGWLDLRPVGFEVKIKPRVE